MIYTYLYINQTNGYPCNPLSIVFDKPNTNGNRNLPWCKPCAYNLLQKNNTAMNEQYKLYFYGLLISRYFTIPSLSVGVLHLGHGFVEILIIFLLASSHFA